MSRNHLVWAACSVALLAGCQGGANETSSAASTTKGPIAFAAVEQRLHAQGATGNTAQPDELLATFVDLHPHLGLGLVRREQGGLHLATALNGELGGFARAKHGLVC